MTRSTRIRLAKTLAGIAIAGVAAAWAAGAVSNKREMRLGDKHEVARMTEKMKTVCIGRFLVDMPQETRLELANPAIDGFRLSTFDETAEAFQARVAAREAEIRAKPGRLPGTRSLESVREVKTDSGLTGKIFVHSRTVTEGTAARGLELERYHFENVAVEAMVHAGGVSVDLGAGKYDPDLIEKLPRLVTQLVTNPQNKIPAEPGFCIDRAYFRDPLHAKQGERIMMFARLPSHPDIEFTLILLAGTKPGDKGLLERNAESSKRLSAIEKLRISRLRAARRIIAGLRGDEVVERFDEDNDSIVYSFWWEAGGTEDDVMKPHLSFTMDTGKSNEGPVPSSLSQAAAMALWDKISSSIRLRPTEAPKQVAAAAPPSPLGTYALAGDRCPESGWWLCGDGGKGIVVLGGQRQYIEKGERMPQALLLPPQTLWEKIRGMQPSYESKNQTAWKLVDKRKRKRVPSPVPLAPATPVAAARTTAPNITAPNITAASITAPSITAPSITAPSITAAGIGPGVMEHQGVAVGSFAATGLPCPASGWWRCEDPRALDGTRWFARGSLLPSATFAVPAGAFGRSAHSPRSIERRGAWRLVRLADGPRQAGSDSGGEPA